MGLSSFIFLASDFISCTRLAFLFSPAISIQSALPYPESSSSM
jgi:hypothetical protein